MEQHNKKQTDKGMKVNSDKPGGAVGGHRRVRSTMNLDALSAIGDSKKEKSKERMNYKEKMKALLKRKI